MAQITDFKSLQDEIQNALIAATRTTGKLSSEDLGFQRSLNREVGPALDEQSERVLGLANALLKSAASISDLRVPALQDVEDVENDWRGVVDVVDSLLEKADTALYEYTGVIKRKDTTAAEPAAPKPKKGPYSLGNAFRTQNLVKPQLAFDVKPDNFDTSPWKPLLTTKPHATRSLEESLSIFTNDFDQEQYRHPYETEILQLEYPASVYTKSDPIPYLPVETTSATFVDTEEGVLEMLEELKTATEIAVDLEHHDARSFVGLVSLMQISTREKDWIVDTLKPWRQKLQVLNEVFADPNIVKVFHGAYMDIVWLQRDLGLYVVGLFDTHYASRSLGYAGGSLAFLLKKFIDFDADKKYQLADWRIRPLPEEMFFYARADTHFLLYIYDNMRNELIDKSNPDIPDENRTEIVLQKSKETSLLRYERQVYNSETGKGPGGWYPLLVKTPALFNNEQFSVFRAVHEWRDKIAREDDDSCPFVMPNHVIFSIAKLLPKDLIALLGIIGPISYSVKSRSAELLEVIKSAQANGRSGPSMVDILRPDSVGAAVKANFPHVTVQATPLPISQFPEIDEKELRSEKSSFWGGAFGSSVWDPPKSATGTDDSLVLALPFPTLSSEVFATTTPSDPRTQLQPQQQDPSPSPTPTKREHGEAFTIRRGHKRRNDEISDATPEETTGGDEISLGDSEAENEKEAKRLKKEGKRRKKAEKKARKAKAAEGDQEMKEEEEEDEVNEEEDEPFDYSAAPSVINTKKEKAKKGKSDNKKGKKKEEPFDPYQKSMDANTGMRRVQGERAGRSGTFKN